MKYPVASRLAEIPPSGIRKFFDLVSESTDPDVISLSVGEPNFSTPWKIRKVAIDSLEKGMTGYTSNKGHESCLSAVSEYMKDQFDCQYSVEHEILITNGVSEGIDIALRAMVNYGDEIIVPTPAYVCYDPLARLAGATVVPVDTSLTEFVLDPDVVERAITERTRFMILSSPANPTGVTLSRPVMEKLAQLAVKYDLIVLSDEIYAELDYDGVFCSISTLPGMKERTLVFNGVSKSFAMTGWRLGFVCGPQPLIEQMLKIHQYSALCSPSMAQFATVEALNHHREYVLDMKLAYMKRRTIMVNAMARFGIEMVYPNGAFYCFPSISPFGLSSEEFAFQFFQKHKVAVVPGTAFGAQGEGFIRCCYASSEPDLLTAMDRMEVFVKELKRL